MGEPASKNPTTQGDRVMEDCLTMDTDNAMAGGNAGIYMHATFLTVVLPGLQDSDSAGTYVHATDGGSAGAAWT